MAVENGQYIEDLNLAWPLATDNRSEGDDHIRLLKSTVQGSFPNTTGPWTTSDPIGCGEPTLATHAATKGYVDAIEPVLGGSIKGSDGSIRGGTGFICLRIAEGEYRITFDDPAGSIWAQSVVATRDNSLAGSIAAQVTSESQCVVYTFSSAGAALDRDFSFLRIRL